MMKNKKGKQKYQFKVMLKTQTNVEAITIEIKQKYFQIYVKNSFN